MGQIRCTQAVRNIVECTAYQYVYLNGPTLTTRRRQSAKLNLVHRGLFGEAVGDYNEYMETRLNIVS